MGKKPEVDPNAVSKLAAIEKKPEVDPNAVSKLAAIEKKQEVDPNAASKLATIEKKREVDPNAVSKLDPCNVQKAVEALLKVVDEAKKAKSTLSLIEENTSIQLQYNFKKIPQMKNKRLHARIPHTLVTDNTDVCLFVKDVHKGAEDQENKRDFTPSVRHFRKIVEDSGVKVEEIIPVIQLKREYRDFEMKKKLCDSFDLFLVDERVAKFMPKLLGKSFHKKRKLPINVKLSSGNGVATRSLKKAFESVHGLVTGQGASTSVTVGHTGLTPRQITENVDAVVKQMVMVLPGGWPNISGLYVTTTKTTSIPLFVSTTSADQVKLPPDVVQKKRLIASGDPGLIGDGEDDDDEEGGIVHVFDDGSIRIQGEGESDEDEEETEGRRKRKKKQEKPASKVNGETQSDPKQKKTKNKTWKKKGKKNPKTDGNKGTPPQKNQAKGVAPVSKKTKVASTKGPLSKKPRLK